MSAGMTRSLLTMVLSATVATMTMAVAAESPPMKTSRAKSGRCSAMGSARTKVSASISPFGNHRRPPNAMGSTKMLMSSR